ncbi:MAG: 4-alpha-glucanotransferase, partial [Nitrococcus sp.]|nr:4-alpha-glucanotransferase [Nitrococcus sp.]
MDEQAAIDRLARLCGIAPDYTDVWGQVHTVSLETKRALLKAMGVAIADSEELHASLAERETGPWRRPLPPVWVHRTEQGPLQIPVTLPVEPERESWHWRLQAEDGYEHQGELHPVALQVIDARKVSGRAYRRYAFDPDVVLQPGYHRLHLARADDPNWVEMPLIIAPAACYRPPALADGNRLWGPAVQLYSVRSYRNGGIGDFTDLRDLIALCHAAGADLVGINPLHSLFPHNPAHASPYSPSSRLFHNVLYLDVEAIAKLDECAA